MVWAVRGPYTDVDLLGRPCGCGGRTGRKNARGEDEWRCLQPGQPWWEIMLDTAAHLVHDHSEAAEVKVTWLAEAPGAGAGAGAEVTVVENVGTRAKPAFRVSGRETRPPLSLRGPGRVVADTGRDHSQVTLWTHDAATAETLQRLCGWH